MSACTFNKLRQAAGEAAALNITSIKYPNRRRSFCGDGEALFNRLIIELWNQRALRCLELDRREFATRLEQRGWTYDAGTHRWSKSGDLTHDAAEPMLFGH